MPAHHGNARPPVDVARKRMQPLRLGNNDAGQNWGRIPLFLRGFLAPGSAGIFRWKAITRTTPRPQTTQAVKVVARPRAETLRARRKIVRRSRFICWCTLDRL